MDRAPFPDVSGLRVRARAREEFGGARGHTTLAAQVRRKDLDAAEARCGARQGSLLCAAWGYILRTYLLHECDLVAFDWVAHQKASVAVGAASTADDAISAVAAQLDGTLERAVGPCAMVYRPDLDVEEAVAYANDHLDESVTVALLAHGRAENIGLSILASPSVHVEGSAQMMLAQVHAVIRALIRNDPLENALDSLTYSSLTHPHPILLETDMGEGGAAAERLEDQFARRVASIPSAIALACCTSLSPVHIEEWSYARLNERAEAIASHLWTLGVGYACPDDDDDEIVAICMPKSLDMYAAILGVLKAGAAWCPIDEAWPAQRQEALLAKSRAKVVLAAGDGAKAVESCAPQGMRIVHIDALPSTRAPKPTPSAFRQSPDRLAYKIWTSGTTGLPKAVGIEHRAAVQGMRALQAAVPTTFDTPQPGQVRFLQFAAYVFDLSIFDIFYAWGHAGTVCFAPLHLLLGHLAPVARALEATHALFTPAVSAMVPRRAIPSMRMVINGGEKLSQAVAEEWTQGCGLVNIYGPAEATLSLTMHTVTQEDMFKAHNIGWTFDTALTVILDKNGRVAPRGAIGELLLGGPQLARGYIGDEDKTRDKFVQHPTLGRVYHTGDLVRCLWDGQYEYLGRNDDQVKINGVRIELLEINAAVKAGDERVRDADTVALPAPQDDEPPRIVSFVVSREEPTSTEVLRTDAGAIELAASLRKNVQALLPSYMVPNHFIVLHAFPRTSSAKIDRVAIRKAYDQLDLVDWEAKQAGGGDAESDAAVLAHPLAHAMQGLIVDMCAVRPDQITAHVPFAALGVNSVKAMAIAAKLSERGYAIGAADLVRHDSMAKLVEASAHAEANANVRATQLANRRRAFTEAYGRDGAEVVPITSLQQSMLLETQVNAQQYWLHRVVALRQPIPLDSVRDAFQKVTDAFECLRMGFAPVRGSDAAYAPLYVGLLYASSTPDVREVSFSGLAKDALPAMQQTYNPSDATPPVHAVLLHASDGDFFVLVLHHAVYDGETLDLILDAFDAALSKETMQTAPFTSALADLIPVDKAEEETSLKVWADALSTYPRGHRIAFPSLAGPEPGDAMRRTTHVAQLPFSALEAAAVALQTSVRPIAQVAWARVLSAYMDTDNILLGDAMSLRSAQPHYATVGGPLLATLAVPVDLCASAASCIQQVHQFQTRVMDYAHVPLSYVRTQLQVPSDRPLFESLFLLEAEVGARRSSALDRTQEVDLGIAVEHALALEVRVQLDGQVHLVLNWHTAQLSEAYADLLLRQVDAMLAAYVAEPNVPAMALPQLPTALLAAPPMRAAVASPTPLEQLAYYAKRTPEAIAVEFMHDLATDSARTTCTYATLYKESVRVALAIAARTPSNAVVAVALARSVDTYIALLGILLSGRTYLPLDESLPEARRAQLISDSGSALVIGEGGIPLAELHGEGDVPRPRDADAAYLLYTSGSTGKPKGCLLSHANLNAAIANFHARFESAKEGTLRRARFLARSAEAFDVHLLEALLPLSVGATIVTMPRMLLMNDLGAAMAASQVTHACVVPSLFTTRGRRVLPSDLPALRLLVVGGEKIDEAILTAWGKGPIPVLNAYGPTEATIGISCASVTSASLTSQIGEAFWGNQYVVLAGEGPLTERRVAMRGEAGELVIVGSHVGMGYLGVPDAPAFFARDGHAAYATGDRARIGPSGDAEYLGRIGTSQVKVRGARVELDEVNAAVVRLAPQYSAGTHATTLLLSHPTHAEPHLVAFVARDAQPESNVAVDENGYEAAQQLHNALRAELSTYMVPSVIVPLQHLPLARVSGKVDRAALGAMYAKQSLDSLQQTDDTPPTTEAEKRVAEAAVQILSLREMPGIHTDLFGLGLDSLRAVRLVYLLQEGGSAVPLASVLSRPTIAGIASLLGTAAEKYSAADVSQEARRVVNERHLDTEDILPCVPLQTATLAQSLGEPAERLYINHVRIPGGSLAQWASALQRHPIYRTVFVPVDDGFVQAVLKEAKYGTKATGPYTEEACNRVADDILASLGMAPPVRLTQYDDVLCLTMHHAVYDAASFAMLCEEVTTGPPGESAPYASFARHAAAVEQQATKYWADALDGMVVTPCPMLQGEYTEKSARAVNVSRTLATPLSQLQAKAKEAGVSLHALFLSSFCSLLSQYVGEDEVTLGLVLSGRMGDASHARVHGPCTTTVPFRWHAGHPLKKTHDALYEMLPYQFVRLASVARALHREGALFDILFSFLPERGESQLEDTMETGYPLALEVQTDAGRDAVDLHVVFSESRLPRKQAELLLGQLGDVLAPTNDMSLRSLVHPDPLVPDEAQSFLAMFAQHVRETPNADAITFATSFEPFEEQTLSYAELDAKSSAYAKHLVQRPGEAVYVHLARSMEVYIVLLAVWKAHKTYVPLDPTLPMERLAYMAQTVGAGTLLSEASDLGPLGALPRLSLSDLQTDTAATLPPPALSVPSYILFTSGSTGKPKGVQIGHKALAAAILSWRDMLPYTPTSRLLQLASPGFDVSLFEICLPLALGFAIGSAPKELLLTDLERAFWALNISMADLPAALASLLHPSRLPKLEWLMSGGDVIDERVVQTWATPPQRLINAYGPTEGTIGNTLGFMEPGTRRSVVGQVYPATTLLVLPANESTPVYAGAIGELVVAGPQVADEYVGAPDLTAAKFPTIDGRRVYRTGDRGRLLCDGRVECLGRMERGQVKVNGQRVELEEIAHELALEGIQDANVQYIQHPTHPSKQLVAFLATSAAAAPSELVLLPDGAEVAAGVLRGASQRLAPYMLPAQTLVLGHGLPLTPNNKVDVARLAQWYFGMSGSELRALRGAQAQQRSANAPLTLPDVLAALGGMLESMDIDSDASFYTLGLDSLSAIRLVRMLRERGYTTTVAELLQCGTPYRLAERLANGAGAVHDVADLALPSRPAFATLQSKLPTATLVPATPLQSGMLAQTVASEGTLYVHRHALRLDASIDQIKEAWARVVASNTILRTSFHAVDDAEVPWVQAVHTSIAPDVTLGPSVTPPWNTTEALAQPLHKLYLNGNEATLWMHHALYDAHALVEILDELDALLQGQTSAVRPPYSALVPHLNAGDRHAPYWAETLTGYVPRLLLAPGAPHAGCTASVVLPTLLADAQAACRKIGVTMHALATLAFAELMAHCTSTADVCFGQVLSLRGDVPDADRIVGPALNTVPTRVRLQGSVAQCLQRVQAQTDAARPHRHAPLRAIQKAAHAHTALVDALLDVQKIDGDDTPWKKVHLVPSDDAHDVHYALNVEFVQRPDALELVGTARTAFADATRLTALLGYMGERVQDIVAGVDDGRAVWEGEEGSVPVLEEPSAEAPAEIVEALRRLLADFAEVPLDEVAPTTPLLALGLDSIASIRLAARARLQGIFLQSKDLAQPHAAAIAASYAQKRMEIAEIRAPVSVEEAADAVGCAPTEIEAVLPVTSGQAMHLANMAQQAYRVGVYSFAYRAKKLDAHAMGAAWEALQRRHALLRSVFTAGGVPCTPFQVQVAATRPLGVHTVQSMSVHDLVHDTIRQRLTPAGVFTRAVADLDLVQGIDGDAVVMTLIHPMYDAWSLPLLLDDLAKLYQGAAPSSAVGIESVLRVPYEAAALRTHFAPYASAPPCLLGGSGQRTRDTFVHRPDAVPLEPLRALASQHGASLPAVLLAGVARVVQQHANTTPVVGVQQNARLADISDVERLAAPCLNVVPLVCEVGAELGASAAHIHATLQAGRPYEQVGLEAVHRALGLAFTPRFNVSVNILVMEELAARTDGPWTPMPDMGLELLSSRGAFASASPLDAWDGRRCFAATPIAIDLCIGASLSVVLRCGDDVLDASAAEALVGAITNQLQ